MTDPTPGISREDVYAGVPVLTGEDGEYALTADADAAVRAVDAFLRQECGETLRGHHRGVMPAPQPVHMRHTGAPEGAVWDICGPGEPGAVPAHYIGG